MIVYLLAFILFFKTCYKHTIDRNPDRYWVFMEAVGTGVSPIEYFYLVWKNCYDSHVDFFRDEQLQMASRSYIFFNVIQDW